MPEYRNIAIKVSPEEHRLIKRLAADTDKTIKDLIIECIHRLVREHEEQEKGGQDG